MEPNITCRDIGGEIVCSETIDVVLSSCGGSIVCRLYEVVLQPILLLLLGIAIVWWMFGLLQWISGAKIEERRKKGMRHQNQGLLGIVIMFSVFAIISMIANTLKVDDPTDEFDKNNELSKDQFIRDRPPI